MEESCKEWKKARKEATETKEERCDYISHLPVDVLASILSLLPIKQAVRTSILSQRWKDIWNLIPNVYLYEDCAYKSSAEGKVPAKKRRLDLRRWVGIIYRILYSRQIPIQRCVMSCKFLEKCGYDVDCFILLLMKHGIQELIIDNTGTDEYQVSYDLFHCQSLRALKLSRCGVKLPSLFNGFCHLKTLDFFMVAATDDMINRLISSCKLLEKLTLTFCQGLKNLKIHAPNLLYLDIRSEESIKISLENAARLVDVSLGFFFLPGLLKEDEANKLVFLLRSLTQVVTLALRSYAGFPQFLCRRNILESLPGMYLNLKKLSMKFNLMCAKEAGILSSFLRNSPCLQDIELWIARHRVAGTVTEQDYWERQRAFHCLTHHLRTIQIDVIDPECTHEIGFLKFLVMNAYMLERISCMFCGCIKMELRNIKEELLSVRASSHACLLFSEGFNSWPCDETENCIVL